MVVFGVGMILETEAVVAEIKSAVCRFCLFQNTFNKHRYCEFFRCFTLQKLRAISFIHLDYFCHSHKFNANVRWLFRNNLIPNWFYMTKQYIQVDLSKDEKEAVSKYAGFVMSDENTKIDLDNKRKKWIRFVPYELTLVIGELSYHFNRSNNDYQFYLLDQLIGHLENCEKRV